MYIWWRGISLVVLNSFITHSECGENMFSGTLTFDVTAEPYEANANGTLSLHILHPSLMTPLAQAKQMLTFIGYGAKQIQFVFGSGHNEFYFSVISAQHYRYKLMWVSSSQSDESEAYSLQLTTPVRKSKKVDILLEPFQKLAVTYVVKCPVNAFGPGCHLYCRSGRTYQCPADNRLRCTSAPQQAVTNVLSRRASATRAHIAWRGVPCPFAGASNGSYEICYVHASASSHEGKRCLRTAEEEIWLDSLTTGSSYKVYVHFMTAFGDGPTTLVFVRILREPKENSTVRTTTIDNNRTALAGALHTAAPLTSVTMEYLMICGFVVSVIIVGTGMFMIWRLCGVSGRRIRVDKTRILATDGRRHLEASLDTQSNQRPHSIHTYAGCGDCANGRHVHTADERRAATTGRREKNYHHHNGAAMLNKYRPLSIHTDGGCSGVGDGTPSPASASTRTTTVPPIEDSEQLSNFHRYWEEAGDLSNGASAAIPDRHIPLMV